MLAGRTMDLLDSSILNVAGPAIRRDIGGGQSLLQWMTAAYTLSFAVLLITGARLGDIYGRRRVFIIGAIGFTAMSAACAAAPSPEILVLARALQGAFGALLIPQGFGLLMESFPPQEMPKVFAIFGPSLALPTLAAPLLAGWLIDWDLWGASWRLVFLINVPIGTLTVICAARTLPRSAPRPGLRLDMIGMVLIGLSLVAIIYPLIQGREADWPAWTFGLIAAGVLLLCVFVLYERRRSSNHLIEPGLLANRVYATGIVVALCYFGAFGGLLLVLSIFVQLGEGFSALQAGLTLTPMIAGMVISMSVLITYSARIGRNALHLGLIFIAAGVTALALVAHSRSTVSSWDLAPALFIVGIGAGSSMGQLFDFVLAGVTHDQVGSASGVLQAVQQLANALGVAVLGTIYFSNTSGLRPTRGLEATARWTLAALAVAFALVFLLPKRARTRDG